MHPKAYFIILLLLFLSARIQSQLNTPSSSNLQARAAFQDDKFGMFINWGPSSLFGAGEWVIHNRNIHVHEYQRLPQYNHHQAIISGEDFQAFEKDLPGSNTTGFGLAEVSPLPLETCEIMNDSWGFNITDRKYKKVKSLIQYMVRAAEHNANFLLNVGPMPNGVIQPNLRTLRPKWAHCYRKMALLFTVPRVVVLLPKAGVVSPKKGRFSICIFSANPEKKVTSL